jgi:hypothetical protein
MPKKDEWPHLRVVLAGENGKPDLELTWEEWQAWQRAKIFYDYERQKTRQLARKPPGVSTAPPAAADRVAVGQNGRVEGPQERQQDLLPLFREPGDPPTDEEIESSLF